jgi:hypothetical protein
MWAIVLVKKDKVYGEAMSKSPGKIHILFLNLSFGAGFEPWNFGSLVDCSNYYAISAGQGFVHFTKKLSIIFQKSLTIISLVLMLRLYGLG